MRAAAAVLTGLALATVAACSSAPSTPLPGDVPPSAAPTAGSSEGSPGGTPPASAQPGPSQPAGVTTTVVTTGGTPDCGNGDVTVKAGNGEGLAGAGHEGAVLVFTNTSGHTCQLTGYPGVTPYVGREPGTPAQRTERGYLGGAPDRPVAISPGETAAAIVEGTDVPEGNATSCPSYSSLRVTPPNLTRVTTLDVGLPGCSRLQVHPVTAGSTGEAPQQ